MTTLDESLNKIGRGATLAFFGTTVGLGFGLLGRILVARIGTESDFGVFSLAIVILNASTLIATLGLQEGSPRCIAYARGSGDTRKVHGLISVSVQISLVASIFLGIIFFIAADLISTRVFDEPELSYPLKIFALGIPFYTLIDVSTSVFRGFDDLRPRAYFREILRNTSFTIFLIPVILLKPSFDSVFYAFLGSIIITSIAIVVYAAKGTLFPIAVVARTIKTIDAKELLLFSMPLFGMSFLGFIISWIDTVMLGIFKNTTDVGLYGAAHTIAILIVMPITAINLIYLPVASNMYAQGLTLEIKRGFAVITKWLCSATTPALLIVVLFPETILSTLFGDSYAIADNALRILVLGYFVRNLFGPSDALMIALGEVHFVMWSTLVAAFMNISLNLILIPPFGIEGAAIAAAVALVSARIMLCCKLYSLIKAHPFTSNLWKPIAISCVIVVIAKLALENLFVAEWWTLPILLVIYYCLYVTVMTVTKSFDKEDITMLLAIEAKTGVNVSFLKRFFSRFI